MSFKSFFKIPHHEFWPWWLMIGPVLPTWIWNGIKLRSATYFTTVNPSIEDGGLIDESKIELNDLMPIAYLPITISFRRPFTISKVMEVYSASNINYPCIAKPDKGGRGKNVALLNNSAMLQEYISNIDKDFMIQEYCDYPLELGVFYYGIPDTNDYAVTSIVAKEFLQVKGDGTSTIEELLQQDFRSRKQVERLNDVSPQLLTEVLAPGEVRLLEPIGNHCRGTLFRNHNHRINQQLSDVFHAISKQIPDFYFGRFDLKVTSWEDLFEGKNIKIIELNGIAADVAHIYDPNMKYWQAIKDQIFHAKIAGKIAAIQIKKGVQPSSIKNILKKTKRVLEDLNA
jgi:hypothetical protein